MKKTILIFAIISLIAITANAQWALTGNSGTSWSTNFVGTTDAVSLRFRTNGAARMIIDSLGKVGIGTKSPSALLELNGSNTATTCKVLSGGTGYYSQFQIGRSSVESSFGIAAAINQFVTGSAVGDMIFRTEAASQRLILNSGTGAATLIVYNSNVGVGTTSPTNLLSLSGVAARTIWMERNTTVATAGQGLTISSGGAIAGTNNLAGGDLTIKSGISTGTGTSSLHFSTATAGSSGSADNSPSEKMTILGSGYVGIGTTSPTYLLSFSGNAAQTFWMERHTTANTAGNSLTIQSGGATSGATDKSAGALSLKTGTATGTGSADIIFSTTKAGTTGTTDRTAAEMMRLTGAGNVGIGITSPTNLLSLSGTAARTIWMERNTTAATAGQGLTISSGGAIAGTNNLAGGDLTIKSGISTGTGTSSLHFYTATAGSSGSADNSPSEKMTILGNGYVGIGTTSPTYLLSFGGNAAQTLWMERHTTTNTAGNSLTIQSGGATSGATDKNGGSVIIKSGTATGTGSASIIFYTTPAGSAGTADNTPTEKMRIMGDGSVGIGTSAPNSNYKLSVCGKIRTTEVVVETGWSDYVFDKDYKLPSLNEVEKYIAEHKHLPNVPSALEVEQNGVSIGETEATLLRKIEELTLYVIALEKSVNEQQEKIKVLESK